MSEPSDAELEAFATARSERPLRRHRYGPQRNLAGWVVMIVLGVAALATLLAVTFGLAGDLDGRTRLAVVCGFVGGLVLVGAVQVQRRAYDAEVTSAEDRSAPGDRSALRDLLRRQDRGYVRMLGASQAVLAALVFGVPAASGGLSLAVLPGLALSVVFLLGCSGVWWLARGYDRAVEEQARHLERLRRGA